MNKDKVIKDLKERNNSLNNQFRLRDIRVNCLEHQNIEKDKEIERLNNIINELENWLAKEYISGCYEELYRIGLQDSYDKLQELKGSDKE